MRHARTYTRMPAIRPFAIKDQIHKTPKTELRGYVFNNLLKYIL